MKFITVSLLLITILAKDPTGKDDVQDGMLGMSGPLLINQTNNQNQFQFQPQGN